MTDPRIPQLPAAPLVRVVERRGGIIEFCPTDAQRRAYARAKNSGRITVFKADELAHLVAGGHPWEIWADWFDWAVEA